MSVVCACLLVQRVDCCSQFDTMSPVHLGVRVVWVLGLSRRTDGGDLVAGGDSAGEVFVCRIHPSGSLQFANTELSGLSLCQC